MERQSLNWVSYLAQLIRADKQTQRCLLKLGNQRPLGQPSILYLAHQ
jgi:hypothetical protein